MKAPKILMAGLLAFSLAGVASAQTVIHITGSTAFRNATVTAITHILNGGFTYGYSGTSFTGANQAIFTGTTINGSIPVIIKTSWSGAVGGVETVSQQIPITTWLTNTTPQTAAGAQNAPSAYDPPAVPEVCMDDGVQATTSFPTPVLKATSVGVVVFQFVRNAGSPSTLNNITPNLAQVLWDNGTMPLSLFTGNHANAGTNVFTTGRDADSGTRKTAFAETGIGIGGFTSIVQYQPTNAAGNIISRSVAGPIAGQKFSPAATINGIPYDVGQGGYSSGGDLAVAMEATGSFAAIHGFYVTYLGLSDANTAITGGASPMAWNGTGYSTYNGSAFTYNDTAVQEGQYTFWAYEQLCYRSDYSGNGKTVADQLANQITATDAILAGELLSSMHVARSIEGGLIYNQ